MKHIKTFTALTAALFLAASLTAYGDTYTEDAQTINTPAKASLTAASGAIGNSLVSSTGSEDGSSQGEYAGEYIMFGLGDMDANFQNKKVVVSSENIESGSVILYSDGKGVLVDGDIEEPVTGWSVNDGIITITCADFGFAGTIEDGVINLGFEGSSDTLYFAREDADLSIWSIVSEDEYETFCMAGTYYLTGKTSDDGSTLLNRTQISWDVLNGLSEASLVLNEDGTGALNLEDHQDIAWNTDSIILNDEEYYLDFEEGVITVDMTDHTLEFTYIGEGDIYLELTFDDVKDSVEKIPGSFYPIGESGLKYYVPDTYTKLEPSEEDKADDLISNFVEEADTNDNDYYDSDIYAYHYQVYAENDLPAFEEILDITASMDAAVDCCPMIINGNRFICCELVYEETDEHLFMFRICHDNGYITDIKYRTEESIMTDEFRSLVFKLASAICPDD